MTVSALLVDAAMDRRAQLADLLIDAVDSGASVGFLPPLSREDALAYWHTVVGQLQDGSRVLIAAVEAGVVQGSVQLALESRANGKHRAEACKLFVHRRARRRGLARLLMAEAEAEARRRGITLLFGITLLLMDTRKGGEAEKLCRVLGYTKYGEVPGYARSADGSLHTTSFYYRELA